MEKFLSKAFKWLVIAMIVYLVITDPHGSADTGKSIIHWFQGAFAAFGEFVDALRKQS